MIRKWRQWGPFWLVAGVLLMLPNAGGSQQPQAQQPQVDATTIALHWVMGRYRMPVTCIQEDGTRLEVEESISIRPPPSASRHEGSASILRATFFGIDVPEVEKCFNLIDKHVPDRRGSFYFTFLSHGRTDLGPTEFRRELRDGEVRYQIRSGRLQERPFKGDPEETRIVTFDGRVGELIVREVLPGSDADKLLARYRDEESTAPRPPRRFEFEIHGPGDFHFRGYFIEDPEWKL